MIRIAVCDDNTVELKCVTDLLDQYLSSREQDFQYDTFTAYSQLQSKASDYDLFILDYKMQGKNGLEFARDLLTEFKLNKKVIFITAYPEIVYEAFTVNTFRFLVKPVDANKLFKALDDYFDTVSDGSRKLFVKVGGDHLLLDLDYVAYFESRGRQIVAYFENSEPISFYCKTKDLDRALDNNIFFRVHRSFSIKLDRVKSFNSNEVVLDTGESIFISSKRYDDFCKAYLNMIKRSYL